MIAPANTGIVPPWLLPVPVMPLPGPESSAEAVVPSSAASSPHGAIGEWPVRVALVNTSGATSRGMGVPSANPEPEWASRFDREWSTGRGTHLETGGWHG